jgi:hypothetical protein
VAHVTLGSFIIQTAAPPSTDVPIGGRHEGTNFDRNVAAKTNRKLADAATYSFDRPRVLNDSKIDTLSVTS